MVLVHDLQNKKSKRKGSIHCHCLLCGVGLTVGKRGLEKKNCLNWKGTRGLGESQGSEGGEPRKRFPFPWSGCEEKEQGAQEELHSVKIQRTVEAKKTKGPPILTNFFARQEGIETEGNLRLGRPVKRQFEKYRG